MTPNELRDAAERLQRDKYDDYGEMKFWKFSPGRMQDVCVLANAYLAESAELARLRAENERLADVVEQFLDEVGDCNTYGRYCLSHSQNDCNVMRMKAQADAILNPQSSTPATLPIEQVRQELADAGINVDAAVKKILDAVHKKRSDQCEE